MGAAGTTHRSTSNASGGEIRATLIHNDSVTEGDETLAVRLDTITPFGGVPNYSAGTPSTVTVTIRGTDSAPTFGTGSVSAKTFTAGAAITEFQVPAATGGNGTITYAASGLPAGLRFDATGTDSPGCPGTEPREVCGTPTAATSGAQTVTITATDAAALGASDGELPPDAEPQ